MSFFASVTFLLRFIIVTSSVEKIPFVSKLIQKEFLNLRCITYDTKAIT